MNICKFVSGFFRVFHFASLEKQQVLYTNINKHQLYTPKTDSTQPCLGRHPCRTMLERFRWSKKLDSLLDNCTLYPFCVCLCLFSILKLNVNGAWNGVSVLFRSDRLFSQKGSLSWSCWTLFEVCPETCLGDKNWCASNVLNESIMHSTWQSTIVHNSPQ